MRRERHTPAAEMRSQWQLAQAARCGCRGSDELCGCQNEEAPWRYGLGGGPPPRPTGWRLVPEEPTHEMVCAGDGQDPGFGSLSARIYRAMVVAAPEAPRDIGIGSVRNGGEADCEANPKDPQGAQHPAAEASALVKAWLDEHEGYGVRMERLVETLEIGGDIIPWLTSACNLGLSALQAGGQAGGVEALRKALTHAREWERLNGAEIPFDLLREIARDFLEPSFALSGRACLECGAAVEPFITTDNVGTIIGRRMGCSVCAWMEPQPPLGGGVEALARELVHDQHGPSYWGKLTDAGREMYVHRTQRALDRAALSSRQEGASE